MQHKKKKENERPSASQWETPHNALEAPLSDENKNIVVRDKNKTFCHNLVCK